MSKNSDCMIKYIPTFSCIPIKSDPENLNPYRNLQETPLKRNDK